MPLSILPRHSTRTFLASLALLCASSVQAAGVVGTGTPASCTEGAFNTALTGGGNVTFNCGGVATITLSATKNITQDTSIDGGGQITLDGAGAVRHFSVFNPSQLSITGLTLFNGQSSAQGGAILTSGNVTLSNVALNANKASDNGGAIAAVNGAQVTLIDAIANGNQAGGEGGVIYATSGPVLNLTRVSMSNNLAKGSGAIAFYGSLLKIRDSAFQGNIAIGFGAAGGAIAIGVNAAFSVVNSTFQGNVAGNSGSGTGGAFSAESSSQGTINNSTFADNGGQGAIEVSGASVLHLRNTIVGRTLFGGNCLVSGNGVLVNDGNDIQFSGSVSKSCGNGIPEVDPKLGPFANNGGFTNTMALLAGSPAIDGGNDATCDATDQRGIARPIGAHCDIGAYESSAAAQPQPQVTVAAPLFNGCGMLLLIGGLLGLAGLRAKTFASKSKNG